MDEESYSTSQDSSNSREAVQMNTGVPLHIVNLREVHCALCGTIYSPANEANRHLNVCQNCEVWRLELYNEESWQVLGESRQRVEEALQGLVETRRNLEETRRNLLENRRNLVETYRNSEGFRQRFEPHRQRVEPHRQRVEPHQQDLMVAWRDLEETWLDLEEYRWNLQETQRELERFRQRFEPHRQRVEPHRQRFEPHRQRVEPHRQRVEQGLIEAWRDVEDTLPDLEENRWNLVETQRDSQEFLQLVERRLECLPRLVITEEHEKKHNGLECAICLDSLFIGSIVNQLPCLHFFHPLCIVPWLKVRMSCPTCRYKLSSAFHNETRPNSNRRIGFQEIVREGSNVNSSSATYDVNEPEVVVSESYNQTTDSSVRDREGIKGGWFLFAAAPIVSLVGIVLVECFKNFLGDERGRGCTGHVKFSLQCQQPVRMFSSGSSFTRTSNSRENN